MSCVDILTSGKLPFGVLQLVFYNKENLPGSAVIPASS